MRWVGASLVRCLVPPKTATRCACLGSTLLLLGTLRSPHAALSPCRLAGLPAGTRTADLLVAASKSKAPAGGKGKSAKSGLKGGGAPKAGARRRLITKHADGSELVLEMQEWRGAVGQGAACCAWHLHTLGMTEQQGARSQF